MFCILFYEKSLREIQKTLSDNKQRKNKSLWPFQHVNESKENFSKHKNN